MKRIRTWAWADATTIDRQMLRKAWGYSYWRWRVRKHQAEQQRRHQAAVYLQLARAQEAAPLPGEQKPPMVH